MSVSLTKKDDGRTVVLRRGMSFELALDESPTTGYRWQISVDMPGSVSVEADAFTPEGEFGGGSGRRVWALQTRASGPCKLRADLRRPWLPAAQAEASFSVYLEITD